MNGIAVIVVSLLCFGAGYALYGRRMERLMRVDPGRKTPAVANYDGVDYVPAKHWSVLFGHHFSSIAGAGPIVGPILAAAIWGWLPAVIWIVAGTIFIGGVHDFCSLVVSARHDGTSITDVAGDTISRPARIIFMSFVWITLILIISVFAHLTAKTFVVQPNIVIPSLGLIPIAMLVGFLLYNRKINQPLVTVFGLALLLATWILGSRVFVTLGVNALTIWGVLLLAYAFIASVLPVQFLLQPRDYLSSFLLLLGLIFGYAGLFVSSPQISYPAYTGWNPK
ncbi:MAG: carbon starvation CstA family protein, partial [Candidatus Omnitrophota bacterium]